MHLLSLVQSTMTHTCELSPQEMTALDVQRRFGICRKTCWNLLNGGKINGRLAPVPGTNITMRVFDAPSIEAYLRGRGRLQGIAEQTTEAVHA